VGVVIPAYNEEANIGNLLHFLRSYPAVTTHSPLELEVWVDVSGSTDHTRKIVSDLARQWPGLHMVDTGHREGLLHALSGLIHVARGDLILRMDADVQVGPDALDSLVRTLTESGGSIVGARIIPAECSSLWVSRLSRTEFDLHHLISLQSPKTTVVQLFRRATIELHSDSGLEDQELQSQIESQLGPAIYDPNATVMIVPPANIRDYLFQRVRTVQHILIHRRNGYRAPSTASARPVTAALLEALRSRCIPFSDLVLFLVTEAFARVAARWRNAFDAQSLFHWEPLGDTKRPSWSVPAAASPTIRAAEESLPPLLR
jgi:glycosyltransferase involved in cell wall biosynthesis